MMTNKKLSLSLLNSLLLLVFFIVLSIAVLFSTYINTQKVVDKNIDDYFKQTYNITKLIIENEQNNLDNVVSKISKEFENINDLNNPDSISYKIETLSYIDSIDLLFFKKNNEVYDYSNSLFDTESIIDEIRKIKSSINHKIINIKVNNEDIVLMISTKQIIDNNTGRVQAVIYAAKILNNNFALLNDIKSKSKQVDMHIFFDNNIIASTQKNIAIDLSRFYHNSVDIGDRTIYSSMWYEIFENKSLNIIYVTKNNSFDVLKESFLHQAFVLLLFLIFCFILLYYLSNKFIIKPFSKLLNYAYKVKDDKSIRYENTKVLEFDKFAYELKGIISELRDVKEQYSRAIDGVQDGLWDVDLKNKKIFYSPRFLTMLGYSSHDVKTYKSFWQKSIHKDDYEKTMIALKEHLSGKTEVFESEYRFKCKNGSFMWIKIRGKLFYDSKKHQSRFTGFHTNINDLVVLQEENQQKERMLYQQSKLASMGEMIGNIAHQWRQPLTVISVIASTISMQLQLNTLDKNATIKDIDKLLGTVDYLSSIIDKFRYFFNPNNEIENFSVCEAIKENLVIFESSYKSNNINLILNLDDIYISGYKFELMQVVINIINNSKDALSEKSIMDKEENYIFMKTDVKDKVLTLSIYDNAGGIDEELAEKIYEPYFTTKHQSQGTGLGLYMSNEIIKKHFNGKLSNKTIEYEYEDKNFKGEEFKIEIPL